MNKTQKKQSRSKKKKQLLRKKRLISILKDFFSRILKILRTEIIFSGRAFFFGLVIVVILLIFLRLFLRTKARFETRPINDFQVVQPAEPSFIESFFASSFTDLFSGAGWIDVEKTTMHQNLVSMAFTFPPVFIWETVTTEADGDNFKFRELRENEDEACIKNKCLVQIQNNIFFDGSPLMLPDEIRGMELLNLSIGKLEDIWVLGAVIKNKGATKDEYEGWIFSFDGLNFKKFLGGDKDNVFVSDYEGFLGFGGTKHNWVVVYGAHEGLAVQIKNNQIKDISGFFSIRSMKGGFKPIVLNIQRDDDFVFYVLSDTKTRPKLIKLFTGKTGWIAGVYDYDGLYNLEAINSTAFAVPEYSPYTIIFKVPDNKIWGFIDKGFDKTAIREIVSQNINNYKRVVKAATITALNYSADGARASFFLSNNGKDWIKTDFGAEIFFPDSEGRELFWRAVFEPDQNLKKSPFLGQINISFRVAN